MSAQLPLTMRWPAQQRFDTFVANGNAAAIDAIARASSEPMPWIFVSGPSGVGKTHLLFAACARASESKRSAQYLSMKKIGVDRADTIRAFGGSAFVAIDDVDAIAGDAPSEHALFDLFNRLKAESSTVVFAATAPPSQLNIALPDLVSRLSSNTQIALKPLGDAARREAVRQRAQARGIDLDNAVIDWMFEHTPRDLGSLAALIERIDRESLAAKRRITIPFLRQLTGS
ncbi:MAG TPA: DnaA regulatory inactivator Hda [Rudaea sp.]|jgi:DnaA family protein|nr:DnaA regulatory inactivator Hda [Rudaea sp.]